MAVESRLNERPMVRRDGLLSEELSDECVVYDRRQNKAHHLNSTLTFIWHRCDGSTSIQAIGTEFERQFSVTNGLDVVLLGLQQLQARDLLEAPLGLAEASGTWNTAMSRRAMVIAGSVLMPAVTSILAPTPAAAKSAPKEKDKKDKE
jgi:hypothetical protein